MSINLKQTPFSYSDLYRKLADQLETKQSKLAIVTLIEKKGSSPQQVGAKMLVSQEQEIPLLGTIGGGSLEAYVLKLIVQQFKYQEKVDGSTSSPIPQIITLNLQRDLKMTCGGEVTLLLEFFVPPKKQNIVVFGAGHISQALVPLLTQFNAIIYCLDDRIEWLDRFQEASNLNKIHITKWDDFAEILTDINVLDDAFFVCITKNHLIDLSIAKTLYLTRTPDYLGVIGSQTKAVKLTRQLKEAGVSQEQLNTFHCPIGSNQSSQTPFEIAISICSELIEQKNAPLRNQVFYGTNK